jgi:hypothetical protein
MLWKICFEAAMPETARSSSHSLVTREVGARAKRIEDMRHEVAQRPSARFDG